MSDSDTSTSRCEDFFHYTSGRFLWDEELRLQERYRWFDVEELKKIAASKVGAQACVSITKLAEGGFNKVFKLVMDNSTVLIARIPNPNSGPPFLTTASEVATMDFARRILDLPIPKVICYCARADNPVASEYIIMEYAKGMQLSEIWNDMELSDKLKIVENIVAIQHKFLSLSFASYGSLYFKEDAFEGCERAEVVENTDVKEEVERCYVIGPIVDRGFWNKEHEHIKIDRGPWKTPEDYLNAIALREIAWLSQQTNRNPILNNFTTPASVAQNSPTAHISLYRKFLKVVPYLLPRQKNLLRSSIWHWDIHASNIFVEGNAISNLIDWQDVWAGPLFLQVRHPRLVDYNGSILLQRPANYNDLDDSEKLCIRTQVEKSLILWTYEAQSKKLNPDVHEIFHTPHGRTRREVVDFASDTWNGDIIPFRECLIRIRHYLDSLNIEIACPIDFTRAELEEHDHDAEGWNDTADFWEQLEGIVNRDGWTANDTYEQALEIFVQLREQGLQKLTGSEREEFETQTRWAVRKDNDERPGRNAGKEA